jgi:ferritin-like metal-binding protein YciE
MKIESLEQLLQEEMQDLYDAEKQLVRALPRMAKAASSDELREAFTEHLEVTKEQVRRCEEIFEILGMKAKSRPCAGMRGIVEEGKQVMEEDASDEMLDAALTGAARRVEHYEISAYDSARALADRLGNNEVVQLLEETLNEEQETDQKLSSIAQTLLENMPMGGEPEGEQEQQQSSGRNSKRSKSSGNSKRSGSSGRSSGRSSGTRGRRR